MKRYSFLFLLALSGSLFAGTASAQTRGGAYVELEPFAARLSDSHFSFATQDSFDCKNKSHHDNENKWGFGFLVALGYDFASCTPCYWGGSIEYTRLDIKHDHHTPHSVDEEGRGLLFPDLGTPNFGPFTEGSGKLDSKYQAVDLLAHYHISGCVLQTQIFGGVRYVKFDEDLHAHFHLAPDTTLTAFERNLNVSCDRDFKGIGPYIGVGGFLPIRSCLGVTGKVAGSFLYARHDQHLKQHFNESVSGVEGRIFDGEFSRDNDHNHRWVPGVSANLGLGYQTTFCNCSSLLVEAGYRYDRYFNVLDQGIHVCDCACGGCARDHDHHHNNSHDDFEFQGPYAKLTWHM